MMIAIAALALAALSPLQNDDKDRLKKFEEPFKDKKDKPPDQPKQDSNRNPGNAHPGGDDDGDDGFLTLCFSWTFGYPFHDTGMRYEPYPYWSHRPDYFTREAETGKQVALTARVQVGRVEHDLMCYGGSGEIRLPTGSSFSIDVIRYHESMPGRDDRLTLQEYAFNFGIAGMPRPFQVTLGLGVAYLQGDGFGDPGFLLQADGDWFVAEPFRIHARIGYMPFQDAGIGDFRLELGLHVNRVAFLVGVRSLINSRGDDLTGPTLGVEVWF